MEPSTEGRWNRSEISTVDIEEGRFELNTKVKDTWKKKSCHLSTSKKNRMIVLFIPQPH